MLLEKIQKIMTYFTPYDVAEMVCCIIITHVVLHNLYKKHGLTAYTVTYISVVCIVGSWLLSYKIISSMMALAAACYYGTSLLSREQATTPSIDNAPNIETSSWIESIFSISIQAFHENVSLTWIIDTEEQLHEMLHAEIALHAYIVPKLSNLIINTIDLGTQTNVLWVNRSGYIVGINPNKGLTKEIPSHGDIVAWSKQRKIVMLQSHAQKRMYSIVHKGVVRDNLSSHHAYHLLKHILTDHPTSFVQELA